MWLDDIRPRSPRLRSTEEVLTTLSAVAAEHGDLARFEAIGSSEEGRPIGALILGCGPRRVSLLAGAHADEPVGPATLEVFAREVLRQRAQLGALLQRFTFVILPHVNPDGAARNETWTARWPDVASYLLRVEREGPGRDIEFGFPDLRPENAAVSALLGRYAPFDLHLSLHGMGVSEGGLLLIERHWIERTVTLRERFRDALRASGLRLFDHDRGGEKGFEYIGPGFSTTPSGAAMRAHFNALGEHERAALFQRTSMEQVRALGGDPLCLVTELPLFVLARRLESARPGVPATYLRFKALVPELRLKLARGEALGEVLAPFGLRPLALPDAIGLQLAVLDAALGTIAPRG